jgi:broad specificity phosphatase PhoE
MKTLEIRRHGKNEGDQLTEVGISELQSLTLTTDPTAITDTFAGTAFKRTYQSLEVIKASHGIKPYREHSACPALGNTEMFQKFLDLGFVEARKELGNGRLAVRKVLGEEEYLRFQHELCEAIGELFAEMPDGSHGIIFAHSPIIEIIAERLRLEMECDLNPGEGILLTCEFQGEEFFPCWGFTIAR